MCLCYNSTATGNVRRQLNKYGKIICYKQLILDCDNKIIGMYYNLKPHSQNWQAGWIKSNRQKLEKNGDDDESRIYDDLASQHPHYSYWRINRGIHVYLKSHFKQTVSWNYLCLLPVVCYARDFVGAGEKEAVFKKVFVKKADWEEYKKRMLMCY